MIIKMLFQCLGVHDVDLLSDLYKVIEQDLCEVWHLEIPGKSRVSIFVHNKNWCRIVVFKSLCLVSVVVDSIKPYIFGLMGDIFIYSSESFAAVTRFWVMEDDFIFLSEDDFFSFLSNDHFRIFSCSFCFRFAPVKLELFFFDLSLWIMSSIENSLDKILQFFSVQLLIRILPDIGFGQKILLVNLFIHAILIIGMHNAVMIILLNGDLNRLFAFWEC